MTSIFFFFSLVPDLNHSLVYLKLKEEEQLDSKHFKGHVMSLIEEGLQIDVNNREIMKILRFKQGVGNLMNELNQEAIVNFTEALMFDETNFEIFMFRAICYVNIFFFDDAIIDLLEVEKLNDNECSQITSEIKSLRKKIGQLYVPKTNYDFLEIPRTANETEIALAFRSLSLLNQLNLSNAKTEAEKRKIIFKFKRVENAFVILSDKKFKKQYDKLLKKQEAEIECPSLRTCCINFGNCYQFFCNSTGSCVTSSCTGVGNCIGGSFEGIGSCFKKTFEGIGSCFCSDEGLTTIMCKSCKSCDVIFAMIIIGIVYGFWNLIF